MAPRDGYKTLKNHRVLLERKGTEKKYPLNDPRMSVGFQGLGTCALLRRNSSDGPQPDRSVVCCRQLSTSGPRQNPWTRTAPSGARSREATPPEGLPRRFLQGHPFTTSGFHPRVARADC
jgi:hypothetical protein